MAKRLPDGSIQLADGRIVYADSALQAQDLCELVPLLCPQVQAASVAASFPRGNAGFGGGGSGSRGEQGVRGVQGVPGPINQVQDEGINLPVENILNFIGNGVSAVDNPGAGTTDITINDLYAATRIVSLIPGDGTDLTIAAAIAALPAEGGTIFVKQGTYPISASLVLPDKNVTFVFAAGSVIDIGSNAIALFTIPNGLTAVREYLFTNPSVIMIGAVGQEFLRIDDAGGMVMATVDNCYVYKPDTLVNFAAVDVAYQRMHQVIFNGGLCIPDGLSSTLVKTSAVPGTYDGMATLTLNYVQMYDEAGFPVSQPWTVSHDGDLIIVMDYQALGFNGGGGVGGLQAYGGNIFFGDGDFTIYGTHAYGTSRLDALLSGDGSTGNSRLVNVGETGMVIRPGYMFALTLKCQQQTFIRDSRMIDKDSHNTNPAIELAVDRCVVSGINFSNGWSNDCIKITSSNFCKIDSCDFGTSTIGKTVEETGTSDKNCIHDNTGFASGTGNTVNINGNDQIHNNIN
jgi:hypothetical protein